MGKIQKSDHYNNNPVEPWNGNEREQEDTYLDFVREQKKKV